MLLSFFGRGAAFSDEHNSAFFADGSELVLIDHSLSAFNRLRRMGADSLVPTGKAERIYVIVTHTHSDHICGIPLLIHYAYYVWHIPVTVAAASEEVRQQLTYYLDTIEGCEAPAYEVVLADTLRWVADVIPTEHTPNLAGRCFGYRFSINGEYAVYTGDTGLLEPFLPYLAGASEFYAEAASIDSGVHLFIGKHLPKLKEIAESGIKVYLMHLDNEEKLSAAVAGTGIELVPLFGQKK